jgi:hypothetical protein
MMSELADIKRDLFYRLLDDAGRVFVHVRPSMELEIGRRGLVGDELNNGITLVFNSHMKFDWGDYGIEAALVFGSTPEKCFIPTEAIDAIYSPELKVQLLMEQEDDASKSRDRKGAESKEKTSGPSGKGGKAEGKVIEVDFHKRKDH